MHKIAKAILVLCIWMSPAYGKVVVFWQGGFPTVESQPLSQDSLREALAPMEPVFVGLEDLKKPDALKDADLLILPYGSAVPVEAWGRVREYLEEEETS